MTREFRFSMRLCAAVLGVSIYASQTSAQAVQTTPQDAAQVQSTTPPPTTQLVVPAGTVVPLTLVSPIKSKSTPVGGTVRASVAFPVTVGTRLAIPEGAFVEGQLMQSTFPKGFKQPKNAPPVSPLKVHFTKLIYPNGYTVSLDAEISVLDLQRDGLSVPISAEVAALDLPNGPPSHGPSAPDPLVGLGEAPMQTQTPTLTNPYAHSGPNAAVIYGPLIAVAAITLLVIFGHHRGEKLDSVLYGPGYQFQLTLSSPLTLDSSRIAKVAEVPDATN